MSQPIKRPRAAPIAAPSELAEQYAPQARPRPESEKDARYVAIGLPSGYQWYSFKQLSIRPLGVQEVKKIYSAHLTKDLRMFYEAMAPCVDQNLLELTVGDVYAVMFWLRINSYPKTPYTVSFTCTDPTHVHHVLTKPDKKDKWKQLEPGTLRNTQTVTYTQLEEVRMMPLNQLAAYINEMDTVKKGIAFYPCRARDLVEIDEMAQEEGFDAGDDFLCRFASYLDPRHGVTLKERYQFMLNNPTVFTPDDTVAMDRMIDLMSHGVKESINLNCTECGASNLVNIPIDARTFLPHLY